MAERAEKAIPKEHMTWHFRMPLPAFIAALFLLPSMASAATLSFTPTNTSVAVGSIITETVWVSSTDQAMNAISGALSFPPKLLQVVSVSTSNSVLSLWVQNPSFSNTSGTIAWSGVVPNPGYTGSSGNVVSIKFRGIAAGTATVVFSSDSQVLANDGNGTDILTNTSPAAISVTPSSQFAQPTPPPATNTDLLAHITSASHPDQTQWYNLSHAIFDWTNAEGVTAVRLGYDQNADGLPVVSYTDLVSHKELDLADGIWYFHVQERGSDGSWGPVASYRVQIDTVPPLPFAITFPQGTTTQAGNPIAALFTTTDALSGIDHYQVAVDGKEFTVTADEGSRSYNLSADSGAHLLLVQAYDKAGNLTSANTRFFVVGKVVSPSPNFFAFGWLAINFLSVLLVVFAIFAALIFIAWYLWTRFMAYRNRLNRQSNLVHPQVHRGFDNLKQAITEEILTLEKTKSERPLTHEEEQFIVHFKELLDQETKETIAKDSGYVVHIPR